MQGPHIGVPQHSTLKSANMEVTRFLPLLGRLLIGLPFLMSGVSKLTTYAATTAYIGSTGLPLAPIGWAIAVAFEIGGGLLLILEGNRSEEHTSELQSLRHLVC